MDNNCDHISFWYRLLILEKKLPSNTAKRRDNNYFMEMHQDSKSISFKLANGKVRVVSFTSEQSLKEQLYALEQNDFQIQ